LPSVLFEQTIELNLSFFDTPCHFFLANLALGKYNLVTLQAFLFGPLPKG